MKKILSVFLSVFLVLGLFLPAFADDASAEIDYTSGTPWLCSCLDGNVTADTKTPDLSEDFYLACNIEGLRNLQIPDGYYTNGTQDQSVVQLDEDIMELFTLEYEAGSHDAQLALNLYSLYTDWDSRNAVGVTPLKKLTDEVERIDSLEAMTEYLGNVPVEDQLFSLFQIENSVDLDDSSAKVLDIKTSDLTLKDSAEYQNLTALGKGRKDAAETLVSRILGKLGYSEEEAAAKIGNCLSFETQLAPVMISEADQRKPDYYEKINNHYTRQQLTEAQGNVPLVAFLEKASGYPETDSNVLEEPDWLAKLNSLYTEENLDLIRDYLIVHGVIDNADSLDRECHEWKKAYDNEVKGIVGDRSDELVISTIITDKLKWPVARLYCERYLSQNDKDRISGLIDEVISEYHGIIEEADFLTDETKAAAIKKLEAIDKQVLWPDDWSKYDSRDLEIASAADGGTLWEAVKAIVRYDTDQSIRQFSEPVDKDWWYFVPNTFNCGYDPQSNSIWIFGAFARGDIYNAEMNDEDLYARLGMVIGHEISHAFDSTGAQFDLDGNMKQWWTDEDWAAFRERNEKLNEYFKKIHPWEGQDLAENKTGEACADMGGMKCMLRMAAKKDGFDYDQFFRSFADFWMEKETLTMVYIYCDDEHPLPYLRVNCSLQQFDQFLDLYGIKEGDKMYLAPEDRVNIW